MAVDQLSSSMERWTYHWEIKNNVLTALNPSLYVKNQRLIHMDYFMPTSKTNLKKKHSLRNNYVSLCFFYAHGLEIQVFSFPTIFEH